MTAGHSWSKPKPWIYFVQLGDVIKIGTSSNVPGRLLAIPGRLVGLMSGGLQRERYLHEDFRHLREVGEWFRADDDLVRFIAKLPTRPRPGGLELSPVQSMADRYDTRLAEANDRHRELLAAYHDLKTYKRTAETDRANRMIDEIVALRRGLREAHDALINFHLSSSPSAAAPHGPGVTGSPAAVPGQPHTWGRTRA